MAGFTGTTLLPFVLAAVLFVDRSGSADMLYVDVNSTNPVPPYTNWATAATVIQDAVDAAAAGDTVLVTNGLYATGGRAVYGTMTNRVAVDKPLALMSLNGPELTVIQGAKAAGGGNGDGAIRCVYLTNGASLSGFTLTNGATRTAGDINRERSGGGLWCHSTNAWASNCTMTGNSAANDGGGVYQGMLIDCIVSNNLAALLGGGAAFCSGDHCLVTANRAGSFGGGVYQGVFAWSAFRSNSCTQEGGGAHESTLLHCLLEANSASKGGGASKSALTYCEVRGNSAQEGGGAYYGVAENCLFVANSARSGGAISRGNALNCTIAGNSGSSTGPGGAFSSSVQNSVIYNNSAIVSSIRNFASGTFDHCCTTPLPPGVGNITDDPLFTDTNGWADLRLQSNSPCINAANNAYLTTSTDLDGNLRIVGGTADMGAYEQQSPTLMAYFNWLEGYGLSTAISINSEDGDGDKATTWQEWKMWTVPTNGQSVLKMLHPDPQTNGTLVRWQSISGHSYTLERATHGAADFSVLGSGIPGQADATSFTDTTATNGESFLYRVSVPE